jgi:hypothetical protein
MRVRKKYWPICAVCQKPVDNFKHFENVVEDHQRGRSINSFLAFCHGEQHVEAYVAGQAPPFPFGPAFSRDESFLI